MNVMKAPRFGAIRGVAAVFVGRSTVPRPEPASLVSCLRMPPGTARGPVTAQQIHSNRVLFADDPALAGPLGEGDAIVTSTRGLVLGIATADCVPIVACDPVAGALGVVHAGWRGTAAGVLEAALRAMAASCGARMRDTRVAIGPSARVCCYGVGAEVTEAFARRRPAEADAVFAKGPRGAHLDLLEANRLQAVAAGVPPAAIEAIDVCTICRPEICHSYRRDGTAAGRMWLLAALTSP